MKKQIQAPILVVDDNEVNRNIIVDLIHDAKQKADEASSGEECLKMVEEYSYQLILMDIRMPGKDGIEVATEIKKTQGSCRVPLIAAMTAMEESETQDLNRMSLFDYFLPKPVEGKALYEILSDCLLTSEEMIVEEAFAMPKGWNEMLPGIDVCKGLHYVGDKEDNYCRLLEVFAKSLPVKEETLRTCVTQKDCMRYLIEIHALKGTLMAMGAVQLSYKARVLERMAKLGNLSRVETEKLFSELERLIKGVEYFLKEVCNAEVIEKSEISYEENERLKQRLYQAIEMFDSMEAQKILEEMAHHTSGGVDLQRKYDKVKAALDLFSFSDAKSALKDAEND